MPEPMSTGTGVLELDSAVQVESPRAATNAPQASAPLGAVKVETEQTAEAAKALLHKQVSRIEVSACCEAAVQPAGPVTEAPTDPEGRRRRVAWLAMTGTGILLIGGVHD